MRNRSAQLDRFCRADRCQRAADGGEEVWHAGGAVACHGHAVAAGGADDLAARDTAPARTAENAWFVVFAGRSEIDNGDPANRPSIHQRRFEQARLAASRS